MTPQKCKELLDAGVLQAYAERKTIEFREPGHSAWQTGAELRFEYDYVYRIKPEPEPPTFEEMIQLVAKHGANVIYNKEHYFIDSIARTGILLRKSGSGLWILYYEIPQTDITFTNWEKLYAPSL